MESPKEINPKANQLVRFLNKFEVDSLSERTARIPILQRRQFLLTESINFKNDSVELSQKTLTCYHGFEGIGQQETDAEGVGEWQFEWRRWNSEFMANDWR